MANAYLAQDTKAWATTDGLNTATNYNLCVTDTLNPYPVSAKHIPYSLYSMPSPPWSDVPFAYQGTMYTVKAYTGPYPATNHDYNVMASGDPATGKFYWSSQEPVYTTQPGYGSVLSGWTTVTTEYQGTYAGLIFYGSSLITGNSSGDVALWLKVLDQSNNPWYEKKFRITGSTIAYLGESIPKLPSYPVIKIPTQVIRSNIHVNSDSAYPLPVRVRSYVYNPNTKVLYPGQMGYTDVSVDSSKASSAEYSYEMPNDSGATSIVVSVRDKVTENLLDYREFQKMVALEPTTAPVPSPVSSDNPLTPPLDETPVNPTVPMPSMDISDYSSITDNGLGFDIFALIPFTGIDREYKMGMSFSLYPNYVAGTSVWQENYKDGLGDYAEVRLSETMSQRTMSILGKLYSDFAVWVNLRDKDTLALKHERVFRMKYDPYTRTTSVSNLTSTIHH